MEKPPEKEPDRAAAEKPAKTTEKQAESPSTAPKEKSVEPREAKSPSKQLLFREDSPKVTSPQPPVRSYSPVRVAAALHLTSFSLEFVLAHYPKFSVLVSALPRAKLAALHVSWNRQFEQTSHGAQEFADPALELLIVEALNRGLFDGTPRRRSPVRVESCQPERSSALHHALEACCNVTPLERSASNTSVTAGDPEMIAFLAGEILPCALPELKERYPRFAQALKTLTTQELSAFERSWSLRYVPPGDADNASEGISGASVPRRGERFYELLGVLRSCYVHNLFGDVSSRIVRITHGEAVALLDAFPDFASFL